MRSHSGAIVKNSQKLLFLRSFFLKQYAFKKARHSKITLHNSRFNIILSLTPLVSLHPIDFKPQLTLQSLLQIKEYFR